jgi:hypothetical protein
MFPWGEAGDACHLSMGVLNKGPYRATALTLCLCLPGVKECGPP